MWRGHREWTVRVEDEAGRHAVSVRDVDTEEAAIEQAKETLANKPKRTAREIEAVRQSSAALNRLL